MLLALSGLLLLIPAPANAAGELTVAPTRVMFDNRTRSAKVNLINTGDETATFRVQLVQKRMTENGTFEDVQQRLPGELFADRLVRFSPRQVTLQPGQSQAIRIVIRKPANLAEGEYRSHMLFRSIPVTGASDIDRMTDLAEQELSVQLIPVLGISIPVIVRHGTTSAEVEISDLQYLEGDKPQLSFTLKRDGNQSVYGDFTVSFTDQSDEQFVISKVNGVAVYTPNAQRKMKMQLYPTPGLKIKNGKLSISYHQSVKEGGKLLAESDLVIQ